MLKLETLGQTQLLTLDRPAKSNALHPELILALAAALDEAAHERQVRVVVLTGAGRSFCAGLDLAHLAVLEVEARVEYMRSAFSLFRQLYELPQPVIAAVNGPAIAGGFDLAAFCDIRLCSTNATFAQTEILLGLTQIHYPVHEIIGLGKSRELALTGRTISAEEARRIGLVSEVYARDELLPAALALASELAARPPEALIETKRLSRDVVSPATDAAMTKMFDTISARLRSEEHATALASYLGRLEVRRRRGSADSA